MRDGYRIIDSDTHVNPTAGVLLRYADKRLAGRIEELKPFIRNAKPDGMPSETSTFGFKTIRYNRVAGQKAAEPTRTCPSCTTGSRSSRLIFRATGTFGTTLRSAGVRARPGAAPGFSRSC